MFDGWQYYSAVWLLLVLALAVGLTLFWRRPRLPEIVAFGVLFVAIIGLYFYLQHTPTFIYFDPGGVERWRIIGSFDEPRLRQELALP